MDDDLFDMARKQTQALAAEHAPKTARISQVVTVCLVDLGDDRSAVITTNVAALHTPAKTRASTGLELAEHAARWIREHPDEVFTPAATDTNRAQVDWPASVEMLAD